MTRYFTEGSRNTPEILYDIDLNIYRVLGHSIPENAGDFYTPFLNWLKENIASVPTNTVFEFSLPYFNSSSLKALYMVLMQIKNESMNGKTFTIDWYIEDEDDFMLDAAETFTEMVGVTLNLKKGPFDKSIPVSNVA